MSLFSPRRYQAPFKPYKREELSADSAVYFV